MAMLAVICFLLSLVHGQYGGKYSMGAANSECPAGVITELWECAAALRILGYEDDGVWGTGFDQQIPWGCSINYHGKPHLNSDQGGRVNAGHRPVCRTAGYEVGYAGTVCCPICNIGSSAECSKAAAYLDLKPVGAMWDSSYSGVQVGCSIKVGGNLHFNSASSGTARSNNKPICKLMSRPTSAPTPMPVTPTDFPTEAPTDAPVAAFASIVCDESMTGKGEDYKGCQDKTRGGITCQRWDSQSPHAHSVNPSAMGHEGKHNYCRNLGTDATIWCYTTDENKRWDYCDPKVCDETLTGKGLDYKGCQTVTRGGNTCQRWDSQSPQKHTADISKTGNEGKHNYCRNLGYDETIWCYTTNPDVRWELCDPIVTETLAPTGSPSTPPTYLPTRFPTVGPSKSPTPTPITPTWSIGAAGSVCPLPELQIYDRDECWGAMTKLGIMSTGNWQRGTDVTDHQPGCSIFWTKSGSGTTLGHDGYINDIDTPNLITTPHKQYRPICKGQYTLKKKGTRCAHGTLIESKEECEAALKFLGVRYDDQQWSIKDSTGTTPGCNVDGHGYPHFNSAYSITQVWMSWRAVCKEPNPCTEREGEEACCEDRLRCAYDGFAKCVPVDSVFDNSGQGIEYKICPSPNDSEVAWNAEICCLTEEECNASGDSVAKALGVSLSEVYSECDVADPYDDMEERRRSEATTRDVKYTVKARSPGMANKIVGKLKNPKMVKKIGRTMAKDLGAEIKPIKTIGEITSTAKAAPAPPPAPAPGADVCAIRKGERQKNGKPCGPMCCRNKSGNDVTCVYNFVTNVCSSRPAGDPCLLNENDQTCLKDCCATREPECKFSDDVRQCLSTGPYGEEEEEEEVVIDKCVIPEDYLQENGKKCRQACCDLREGGTCIWNHGEQTCNTKPDDDCVDFEGSVCLAECCVEREPKCVWHSKARQCLTAIAA